MAKRATKTTETRTAATTTGAGTGDAGKTTPATSGEVQKTTAATDSTGVASAGGTGPAGDPMRADDPLAAREVAKANNAERDPVTGAILTAQEDPINPNLTSGVQPPDGTAGMEGRPDGDFIIQTDVHSAGLVQTFKPGEPALSLNDQRNADQAARIEAIMGAGSREMDAMQRPADFDPGSVSGSVEPGDKVRYRHTSALDGETEFDAVVSRVKPNQAKQLLVDLDVDFGRLGSTPIGSVPEGDPSAEYAQAGGVWFKG